MDTASNTFTLNTLNSIKCENTFNTHNEFIYAIQQYIHENGFSVRLEKVNHKKQSSENKKNI